MGRKSIVIVLAVVAVAVMSIAYTTVVLNSQTVQPSTTTSSCKTENVIGNFTSTPQMNDTSSGPYNVTFFVQNLAPQSATVTEFTDQNGLSQPVDWTVPSSSTASFQTMISKAENSLLLVTSCGSSFTALRFYESYGHHYEVTLYVIVGNAAS